MFICSVRAGTLKLCSILLLSGLLVTGLLVYAVPTLTQSVSAAMEMQYTYTGAKDDAGRRAFLSQFGWQTAEAAAENVSFVLPEEFDRVMLGYNEIQRAQGLDLSRYKKKTVERYTYEITNYDGYEGKVYANLIVYRGRVIGGDISSADPNGFVQGFIKKSVS